MHVSACAGAHMSQHEKPAFSKCELEAMLEYFFCEHKMVQFLGGRASAHLICNLHCILRVSCSIVTGRMASYPSRRQCDVLASDSVFQSVKISCASTGKRRRKKALAARSFFSAFAGCLPSEMYLVP